MLNIRLISKLMGNLICLETIWLLICAVVSLCYGEPSAMAFVYTAIITIPTSLTLIFIGRKSNNTMTRRDGYFVVSVAWIVFTLVGMMPYLFSGSITSVTKAFFETMSGFTTTGASIMNDINSQPHGILLWRSLTQWIGGLGIVLFTVAVLPTFGVGDIKLFSAEATGPTHGRITPRISNTAKWLWTIYLALTAMNCLLLCLGGIDFFDSITHALSTVSTGGYSTKQSSLGEFNSIYCEYVTIVFMFLGGCNFLLMYNLMVKRHLKFLRNNEELKWYATSILVTSGIIALLLAFIPSRYTFVNWEQTIRDSLFQVTSIMTSTGFATSDYMLWPQACWPILLLIMIQGACAGSTTGGLKCVRIVMLVKLVKNEINRLLHPTAVFPLRIDSQVIDNSTKIKLLAFVFLYFTIILVATVVLMLCGTDFMESESIAITSLCNVGPGLGKCGPAYTWDTLPDATLWISSILMLIGRLEIFAVMIIFTPSFWRDH